MNNSEMDGGKSQHVRFDKDDADADEDGKRHDNPNHSGIRSHERRMRNAEDTRHDLDDLDDLDDGEEDDGENN